MDTIFNGRKIATAAVFLAVLTFASTARADVVYLGVNPATGSGIGSVATILSIHNTGFETGSVAWNGSGDVTTGDIAAIGNTQTRTLAELGVTTSGSQLRIIFNINETGHESADTSFVHLQTLTFNIYDSAGNVVGSYSFTGGPLELSQSSGIGGSGHLFGLDAAQALDLTGLIGTYGAGNLRIGIDASVGCPNGGTDRQCTDDGFETFFGGSVPGTDPIPEPASLLLLGTGLIGLAGAARRRFKK